MDLWGYALISHILYNIQTCRFLTQKHWKHDFDARMLDPSNHSKAEKWVPIKQGS